MKPKILFVERKANEFVSIEKAFREVAEGIANDFETEFQQAPYGNRFTDTLKNLLFFKKKKADIYHITGHIHYIALLFSAKNTILSIMDVRFLYTSNRLKRFILKKLYLDLPVKKLKYITAISEQTKREIIKYTGCDEKKIRAIDLPLLPHVYFDEEKIFNAERPTILQVGTMENKNIPNLAKALNKIDCKLKIIGRMDAETLSVLEENNIDFENDYDLDDEQLRREYNNADIVAFCSIYEGFGLPILEAQAMRKPLITSNLSPMKEVSGGAAFLADPHDVSSIQEGILKIINDESFREKIIRAGVSNIERFKPRNIAGQYASLYREILET